MKETSTTKAEAASTRAPDKFPKKISWKWSAAKGLLPLLIPFLGPAAISSRIVHNNNYNSINDNKNNTDHHHHHDDRHNRQLLEHGLRGGDDSNNNNNDNIDFEKRAGVSDHAITTTTATATATDESFRIIPVSNTTFPLHAHSGTHHVHLYIGSPPQRQTLIVDTGSRAMAFPCRTCETCTDCCGNHASPYFDPSKSSTHVVSTCGSCLLEGISNCNTLSPFKRLTSGSGRSAASANSFCIFTQKYTEGSTWTAIEVEDLVWLGSSDGVESLEHYMQALAVAYPFGCQTSSTGLFRNQYADGILGLSIHETSLVTAFYNEGLIPSNAFSLCFTQKGGVLSLGGSLDPHKYHYRDNNNYNYSNNHNHNHNNNQIMKTTPVTNQQQNGYYSVEVIRLVVGHTIVVTDATTKPKLLKDMNSGKGCILDSGTTDSYFPASLSKAVRRAVMEYAIARGSTNNDASSSIEEQLQHHLPIDDPSLDLFSAKLRHKEYTHSEFERFLPTITLVFANEVVLNILPQHYMELVPIDASSGSVVPWDGFLRLTNRLYFEEPNGSVLGANALIGYNILFDGGTPSNTKTKNGNEILGRIGIAPSDCHAAAKEAAEQQH